MPGFLKGWLITDLVFCACRVVLVLLAVIGGFMMEKDNPLAKTVWMEIASGVGIAVFGLSADILLLCRKGAGVALAVAALVFTFLNVGVGVYQLTIPHSLHSETLARIGMFIGGGLMLACRLAFNAVYVVVIVQVRRLLVDDRAQE